MVRLLHCTLGLLLLLTSPVAAEGWFTDPALELNIKFVDATEIKGLLFTLVPDVRCEVQGHKIFAFGKKRDLKHFAELVRQLDTPLYQTEIGFLGVRLLPDRTSHLRESWARIDEDDQASPIRTFYGIRTQSWGEVPRTYSNSSLAKSIFDKRKPIQDEISVELPPVLSSALIGSKKSILRVRKYETIESVTRLRFGLQSDEANWERTLQLYAGNSLKIAGESGDYALFITLYSPR